MWVLILSVTTVSKEGQFQSLLNGGQCHCGSVCCVTCVEHIFESLCVVALAWVGMCVCVSVFVSEHGLCVNVCVFVIL